MSLVGFSKYRKGVKHLELDIRTHDSILDTTLEMIMDAVVEGGTGFQIPGVGVLSISVERNKFKKKCVNTAESLKERKRIIERGEIPLKYDKDESGKVIGDNGGEPWLQYYINDTICAWRINGKRLAMINDRPFSFIATRENKKKLHNHIESNTLKESLYAKYN